MDRRMDETPGDQVVRHGTIGAFAHTHTHVNPIQLKTPYHSPHNTKPSRTEQHSTTEQQHNRATAQDDAR